MKKVRTALIGVLLLGTLTSCKYFDSDVSQMDSVPIPDELKSSSSEEYKSNISYEDSEGTNTSSDSTDTSSSSDSPDTSSSSDSPDTTTSSGSADTTISSDSSSKTGVSSKSGIDTYETNDVYVDYDEGAVNDAIRGHSLIELKERCKQVCNVLTGVSEIKAEDLKKQLGLNLASMKSSQSVEKFYKGHPYILIEIDPKDVTYSSPTDDFFYMTCGVKTDKYAVTSATFIMPRYMSKNDFTKSGITLCCTWGTNAGGGIDLIPFAIKSNNSDVFKVMKDCIKVLGSN